jgi:hypothetical protein
MAERAQMLVAGRWVPAVPGKSPIDVRWKCPHEWTPHVFPNGCTSSLDYDCLRCGVGREFGSWPEDGPDRVRRWIALKLCWPWVIRGRRDA